MIARIEDMIEVNPSVKLQIGIEYPLINIDKITPGLRSVCALEKVIYQGQSGCKFQNGDTLMARITPCLENGKIAQAKIDADAGIGSTELYVFRNRKDKTNSKWVFYFISSPYVARSAVNSMTGASGRQRADRRFIERLKYDFPDLSTQTKIADILSAYDDAIENNNRRIKILEQLAENLYKEWFVRMRFPGHDTVEYENGLPKGWEIKRIETIGKVVGGGTPSTSNDEYWNGDIPWLTPADLSDNKRVFVGFGKSYITALGLKSSGAKLLPANTVLLSSRAPVGYVAISANPICTNQGFKSVICNNSLITPYYLYFYLKYHREMLENYATGATFPELSATRLKRIKILVPDIDCQHDFEKIIQPMLQTANDIEEQNIFLARQRDLLLPRLMSGKMERFA